MSTRLRTRVWLPALLALAAGGGVAWYAYTWRPFAPLAAEQFRSYVGRQVLLNGAMTAPQRAHVTFPWSISDAERHAAEFVVDLAGEVPPVGHDVVIGGRLTSVEQVGRTKQFRLTLADVQLSDAGDRLGSPAPTPTMTIGVHVKDFTWSFRYPNGRVSRELHLPKGQAVQFDVTSGDNIHSMRLQLPRQRPPAHTDAVPGRTQRSVWVAYLTGRSKLLCAEYCGARHASCNADLVVETPADFQAWLTRPERASQPATTPSASTRSSR